MIVVDPIEQRLVQDVLAPIKPEYANPQSNIEQMYDWDGIWSQHRIKLCNFISLTLFYAEPDPKCDKKLLNQLDIDAHGVAVGMPGYMAYSPDMGLFVPENAVQEKSLSFCLWRTIAHAKAAVKTEQHGRAVAYSKEAYKSTTIKQYLVGRLAVGDPLIFKLQRSH